MLIPGPWACWVTQSIAAITWDTSVAPSAAPTFTSTIRASGATPTNLVVSLYPDAFRHVVHPVAELVAVAARPAIRPAMNVPCPNASRPGVAAPLASNDRSGPVTTCPAPASPGTGVTPVSITATSTPLPVTPAAQALCAPTIWLTAESDPVSAGSYPNAGTTDIGVIRASGDTDTTPASFATPADGPVAANPLMIGN